VFKAKYDSREETIKGNNLVNGPIRRVLAGTVQSFLVSVSLAIALG